MERFTSVKIRKKDTLKRVKISSRLKPEILQSVIAKWQTFLNTTAEICNVPSGLITKLNETTLEVFINSETNHNPFNPGDTFEVGYGHYCESVVAMQKEIIVANASTHPIWKNEDSDSKPEMIAYLGVPINWPDGEVFGTVCLLDRVENHFSVSYLNLVKQLKEHIESDLNMLMLNEDLAEKNQKIEHLSRIKSKFLGIISHDVRGGISSIEQLLNILLSNYSNYNQQNLRLILESLNQTTGSVLFTLENILTWSKLDLLELKPQKKDFNLIKTLKDLLLFFQLSIDLKHIRVTEEYFRDEMIIKADEDMINTCLRNIISNAIKFNKINGQLFIRIFKQTGHLTIEIEDTGIGMNQETINSLFTNNHNFMEKGTSGEKCTGIGLFLAHDFLKKNNARLNISSLPEKGSKFTILFRK